MRRADTVPESVQLRREMSPAQERLAESLRYAQGVEADGMPPDAQDADRTPEKYVLRYSIIWVSFERKFLDGEQK